MVSRMRALVLVWFALVSVTAFAQTGVEPLPRADFKGSRLGMTMEEWKQVDDGARTKRHICKPVEAKDRALGDVHCDGFNVETVAGVSVSLARYTFFDNVLESISLSFNSDDFGTVAASLEERFGPPNSKERETVQTRAGATYENDLRRWTVGTDTVLVRKYAASITRGNLRYASQKSEVEYEVRTKQRAKEGKKDL